MAVLWTLDFVAIRKFLEKCEENDGKYSLPNNLYYHFELENEFVTRNCS